MKSVAAVEAGLYALLVKHGVTVAELDQVMNHVAGNIDILCFLAGYNTYVGEAEEERVFTALRSLDMSQRGLETLRRLALTTAPDAFMRRAIGVR